tara:strand:- start:135 stop:404 length:270 start_codon:yes stop_codon:yes gene_type:complete
MTVRDLIKDLSTLPLDDHIIADYWNEHDICIMIYGLVEDGELDQMPNKKQVADFMKGLEYDQIKCGLNLTYDAIHDKMWDVFVHNGESK